MIRTQFRTARPLQALLLSASALAIATPAAAHQIVFATDRQAELAIDQRASQASGLTQVRLDSGAMVSFVDNADYRIGADGSVDLYAGSVTVAGAEGVVTVVRMPDGVEGRIGGGAAASFSVGADGKSRGHALSGNVAIMRAGNSRTFEAGEMWAADPNRLRQVVSNGAQTAPGEADEARVAAMKRGGPIAAAANGLPVSLGDALAASGAAGDVLAAARRVEASVANPTLATFPTGDLALLVAHAAQLRNAYGAQAFPGAEADIIRAYLGYLAGGGSGASFLTAYSGILVQYLDLLRAGALPSSFEGAALADLNAFVGYTGRTSGFGAFSAQNRTLIEAYLAFLTGGGNPDAFVRSYTDLVDAYFAFVRGGGDPLAFQGATQQTLAAYIGFLSQSGLAAQLSAADRALIQAYLANGGLAFTSQYRAALDAYFAYLAAGNLPSGYTALDAATLRAYLEALRSAGLFDQVLGDRAEFYAAFLAHLRAGGAIDAFAGLNANVFAGYATQLNAYYDYLLKGGQPSAYTALTQQQIAAYLAALQGAGATGAFLDDLAEFYSAYFAYLAGGGNPDVYTGLPVLNLPGFAEALNAYAAFLAGGGLPSGYTAADLATLAQYIDALSRSGQLADLLGANADLLQAYFAYLAGGGGADDFAGLPVYVDYLAAIEAYYAYLASGGVPSGYTLLTQAQIRRYLLALNSAGVLQAELSEEQLAFVLGYLAYLQSGGNPDEFPELPVNNQPATLLAGADAWIFSNEGGRIAATTTADVEDDGQIVSADLQLSPTTVITFDYSAAENILREHGRAGNNVAWTRYERGAAFGVTNANVHFLLGSPATQLPASGTVEYKLIGGTAPTDSFAPAGEVGAFSGNLAVAFGTAPRVGLDFDVHVGTRGWHAETPGGAAGAATGGLLVDGAMRFSNLDLQRTGIAGDACTGYCNVQVYGGLFGTAAANAGFQYHIDDQSGGPANRNYVNGVAVFGTTGSELALIGTMPGGGGGTTNPPDEVPPPLTGYAGGFAAPTANVNFVVGGGLNGSAFAGSESGFQTSSYAVNSGSGAMLSYTRDPGGTTRTNGSAVVTDIFGNADALIGRWHNGTNTGATPFTMSANQGLHYLLARPLDPAVNLPASGRLDYYLTGATSPTIADGSYAPGTFEAGLAILFGAQNRMAMEGEITMPGGGSDYVFSFATVGGLADAAQSTTNINVNASGHFNAFIGNASDSAGNCSAADSCGLSVFASFAGDQNTLGMTYQAHVPVAGKSLVGAAIFQAGPNRTAATTASLATTAVPAAEWARWSATAGQTGGPTLDGPALQRAAVERQALDPAAIEKGLGGLIKFDRR